MNLKILFLFILYTRFVAMEEVLITAKTFLFNGKEIVSEDFFIDKTEVSFEDYLAVYENLGLKPSFYINDKKFFLETKPVIGIDWYDAYAYCRYLGKRLPTYNEFLRAGFGEFEREFPFGDEVPEQAPFITYAYKPLATSEVMDFPELKSADGLYNLAGNVEEWVMADSKVPQAKRLVYGGSYASHFNEAKNGAFRLVNAFENSLPTIGFRCARTPRNIKELSEEEQEALILEKQKAFEKVVKEQRELDENQKRDFLRVLLKAELEKRKVSALKYVKTSDSLIMPEGAFYFDGEINLTKAFSINLEPVNVRDYRNYLEKAKIQSLIPFLSIKGRLNENQDDPAKVTYFEAESYCKSKGMQLANELEFERAWHFDQKGEELFLNQEQVSKTGLIRPVNTYLEWLSDQAFFVAKARGLLIEEQSASSRQKRGAFLYTRNAFRCLKRLDSQLDFEINIKDNYLTQEFYKDIQNRIDNNENVFDFDHQSLDFEKRLNDYLDAQEAINSQ